MTITATEFKGNVGRYLSLAHNDDILITKNGKAVAKLSNAEADRTAIAKSLFGILKGCDMTLEQAREERITRHEIAD